jgi:hypothetical protein
MASVSARRAGVASAINNAVSRAGAPLVSALLFIALSAGFYPTLATLLPGLDVTSPAFRAAVQPLTPPDPALGAAVEAAVREASTAAFHLAMLVTAALLALGAAINGIGLGPRTPDAGEGTPTRSPAAQPPEASTPSSA